MWQLPLTNISPTKTIAQLLKPESLEGKFSSLAIESASVKLTSSNEGYTQYINLRQPSLPVFRYVNTSETFGAQLFAQA